ncbi:hypothetical protein Acr_28g0012370 [Actinidia rufa]|uniref:Uncharacterized protein n=1 Tax=Actinidia rufa TaxID=165716 RepID=A0A7J0HBR3_9ERIC|nr:hypothetical protein Acr_28g0012370 [Actinidia rufa]
MRLRRGWGRSDPSTKRSIYKVPARMTEKNKEAYVPQVVSFGPYHHGEEHLMPLEEHKHRALFHFLKRRNMPLQTIVDNLTKVVQDLKDSYDSLGEVWQSDTGRFLRLMVLDGCFMLEVLCYYAEMSDSGNYAPKDPIFSAHGMLHVMPYIRRDMFLLENQLPMLVLIELAVAMNLRYTEHHGFGALRYQRVPHEAMGYISCEVRPCLPLEYPVESVGLLVLGMWNVEPDISKSTITAESKSTIAASPSLKLRQVQVSYCGKS